MNVFGYMDKGMVVGYLKEGGVTDPDIIRSRFMALRSKLDLYRLLSLIPIVMGCLQIVAGIIGLIILVGIFLLLIGAFFLGGGLWLRSRLTKNLRAATDAYRDYTSELGMPMA